MVCIDQHEFIKKKKNNKVAGCIDEQEVITEESGKVAVCIDQH